MADIANSSGVKVLTWYDCEIQGEKAKYSAKFLCTSETEAQLKCISFLHGEQDTLVSCKVTPTVPVGSLVTVPRDPPPWYNTEPRGVIVPEKKDEPQDDEDARLAVLKKHLYFVPINVEPQLYTYKAKETTA